MPRRFDLFRLLQLEAGGRRGIGMQLGEQGCLDYLSSFVGIRFGGIHIGGDSSLKNHGRRSHFFGGRGDEQLGTFFG